VGQANRKVLELSRPLFEMSIEEWDDIGGPPHKSIRGTNRFNRTKWNGFLMKLRTKIESIG